MSLNDVQIKQLYIAMTKCLSDFKFNNENVDFDANVEISTIGLKTNVEIQLLQISNVTIDETALSNKSHFRDDVVISLTIVDGHLNEFSHSWVVFAYDENIQINVSEVVKELARSLSEVIENFLEIFKLNVYSH